MCSRGNMSWTLLYIYVETYTHMSENVRQTGSQGEARHLSDMVLRQTLSSLSHLQDRKPRPPPSAAIL